MNPSGPTQQEVDGARLDLLLAQTNLARIEAEVTLAQLRAPKPCPFCHPEGGTH